MTPAAPPPGQTYLAKDYASFRALMLDHLARCGTPAPTDVASLEIALIEGLAYIGDYLSYYQDAVATETYMRTARQRVSVARHARMLGYRMVQGCSARTLLHFTTLADDVAVPAGTTALTAIPGWDALHVPQSYETGPAIPFETLHPLVARRAHNRMTLAGQPLRAGDCTAVLAGHLPRLAAGDILVLRREPHAGGGPAGWCHPLRLLSARLMAEGTTAISWHPGDALSADTPAGGDWAVLGNMALADHGRGVLVRDAISMAPGAGASLREAVIECRDLTYAAPYDPAVHDAAQSALAPDPQAAQPALWLTQALPDPAMRTADWPFARWTGRRDILRAGPDEAVFAVETLGDHPGDDAVRLRFGDGVNGRSPAEDFAYIPTFRTGCGAKGNIGAGTIAHVAAADPLITGVTNPLPALGGLDPEALGFARVNAIAGIDGPGWRRCVTADDYAAAVAQCPGVEAAHAEQHISAAGRRITISVTRASGDARDPAWQAMLRAALAPVQLLGDAVSIVAP